MAKPIQVKPGRWEKLTGDGALTAVDLDLDMALGLFVPGSPTTYLARAYTPRRDGSLHIAAQDCLRELSRTRRNPSEVGAWIAGATLDADSGDEIGRLRNGLGNLIKNCGFVLREVQWGTPNEYMQFTLTVAKGQVTPSIRTYPSES